MRNVVLVEKETGNSFEQVMNMPYIVFLCHLYWIQQLNFESYEDQMSLFGLSQGNGQPKSNQIITEPDWAMIKKLGGDG